ncbi:MAG: flagellar biosynthesis repressor FlbT [Mesorhizobium sp.]
MKNSLRISLKPNEKIYINGAVVKVDRKVSIELLNDVQFLLENHVMQADQASTPLRQLYFMVQIMLMTPGDAAEARALFRRTLPALLAAFADDHICRSLKDIDRLVSEGDVYAALKAIRALYPLEAEVLEASSSGIADYPVAQLGAA